MFKKRYNKQMSPIGWNGPYIVKSVGETAT